jgi:hypothetical protein
MGPIGTLDAVVKRKIPSPRRESNPRIPIVQPLAYIVICRQFKEDAPCVKLSRTLRDVKEL